MEPRAIEALTASDHGDNSSLWPLLSYALNCRTQSDSRYCAQTARTNYLPTTYSNPVLRYSIESALDTLQAGILQFWLESSPASKDATRRSEWSDANERSVNS